VEGQVRWGSQRGVSTATAEGKGVDGQHEALTENGLCSTQHAAFYVVVVWKGR
jgi:hypothetical protein